MRDRLTIIVRDCVLDARPLDIADAIIRELTSDAAVERVAAALYGVEAFLSVPWEEALETTRAQWRNEARRAIAALLETDK